jgi:hypothetical protein
MMTYIVYSDTQGHSVYASEDKDHARLWIVRKMTEMTEKNQWPFKGGRYYVPYVILDVYVHDADCFCYSCTGDKDMKDDD